MTAKNEFKPSDKMQKIVNDFKTYGNPKKDQEFYYSIMNELLIWFSADKLKFVKPKVYYHILKYALEPDVEIDEDEKVGKQILKWLHPTIKTCVQTNNARSIEIIYKLFQRGIKSNYNQYINVKLYLNVALKLDNYDLAVKMLDEYVDFSAKAIDDRNRNVRNSRWNKLFREKEEVNFNLASPIVAQNFRLYYYNVCEKIVIKMLRDEPDSGLFIKAIEAALQSQYLTDKVKTGIDPCGINLYHLESLIDSIKQA